MFGPLLGSIAFGLLKGLTSKGDSGGPSIEMDFMGPVREELIYRGAPLWAAPGLPYGLTAVAFATDHIVADNKQHPMTTGQAVARFGDVLLGGMLYESAMRSSGILGAIASHVAHNAAVGAGERFRRRKP